MITKKRNTGKGIMGSEYRREDRGSWKEKGRRECIVQSW
jgi:hypothetical protein